MNKEEIEELKEFTIDLTDIDELALGLEICSKKSNMVIQEFADTIIQLQQENKKYKEIIDKASNFIDYNTKYRNSADIYQFVDIESEILEPLKFILELDEENGNAYLKEFKDWLNEVE